ncbi:hypothetical protein PQX77_002824 [Marasmius sp. AFHP31]|nr:hypothetical protein PQX77_002824 [Marasmius sp. AFHP31]
MPNGDHLQPGCHLHSCAIGLAQSLDPIFPLRNADVGSLTLETALDHAYFAIACRFTPQLIARVVCARQQEHVGQFLYDGLGDDLQLIRIDQDNVSVLSLDARGESTHRIQIGRMCLPKRVIRLGVRDVCMHLPRDTSTHGLRAEALASLDSDVDSTGYQTNDDESTDGDGENRESRSEPSDGGEDSASEYEDTSSSDDDAQEPPKKRRKLYAAMSTGGRAPPHGLNLQDVREATPTPPTRRIANFEELEDGSFREYIDLLDDN